MLSKYTALFLGAGVLLWLILVREQRHWLATPWPYLAAILALLLFVPNLVWNAGHDWMSMEKQFGRVGSGGGLSLRFLGDFVAVQAAPATPFIAVLMVVGLVRICGSSASRRSPLALLGALVLPATLYFLWHSLHDRVSGNWPSFVYPMLSIAAAVAAIGRGSDVASRVTRVSRTLAVPVALFVTAVVYLQALTGIVPTSPDPLARLLAVGYAPVAEEVDALLAREGAAAILTSSYAHTGWLSFYLPSQVPVIQIDNRRRWPNQTVPDVHGPLLYFTEASRDQKAHLSPRFESVTQIARITRRWNGREIEDYLVYRVSGASGPLFGN